MITANTAMPEPATVRTSNRVSARPRRHRGPVGGEHADQARGPPVERPADERQVVGDTEHLQDSEPLHSVVGQGGGGERDQGRAGGGEQPGEPEPWPADPLRRAGDDGRGDDGEEGGQRGGDRPVAEISRGLLEVPAQGLAYFTSNA